MIILKSRQEIEKIRKACLIVADVLEGIVAVIRPGVTTQALDEYAEKLIIGAGAIPAFKGYRGYPKTLVHVAEQSGSARHPLERSVPERR